MSVVAKAIIPAQYASNSGSSLYQAPTNAHTIIDKFTALNSNSSSVTLSVWLVPSGGSHGNSNLLINNISIAAGALVDLSALQNQILNPGDSIFVLAGTGSVLSVRASGREVA